MSEEAVGLPYIHTLRGRTLAAVSSPWSIALAALALRLTALDRKSLWFDEVATLRFASQSIAKIILVQLDGHPPFYYALMHYWIILGQNEFIMRVPSACVGAAAALLLYKLVDGWNGQWSATASAWLLTIAPLHVWYSQEARMYALIVTLGLASTWAYLIGIRRGGWAWVVWIAATATGLYTNYAMLLLLFAQIALFIPLWQQRGQQRRTLWQALLALSVAVLLFAPQGYIFVERIVIGGANGGLYASLQSLLFQWHILVSVPQLHTTFLATGVLTLALICLATWTLSGHLNRIRLGTGAILASLLVYLLILLGSATTRGLLVKRLGLVMLPYVLTGIAAIVATHRQRHKLIMTAVLVTLPFTGYTLAAQEKEAWRDVARLIEPQTQSSDIILIYAAWTQWAFDYYYQGKIERQGIGRASVPKELSDIATSHDRTWLVLSSESLVDPQGTVQAWFDSYMHLIRTWSYPGIRIRLYERGAQ